MRKTLGVLAILTTGFVAPTANAETWYAGIFGGLNITHDGDVNGAGTNATYDLGYGIGGYVGYFLQDNVRLEGELSYRANDLDTIGGVATGGEVESLAFMVNVLFDVKIESRFEPYIGAGIGFADVDYTVSGVVFDDTAIALQLILGAGVEVAPGLQFTADYRLFLTDDLDVGGGAGLGSVEYLNSSFLLGIRKSF